MLDLIKLSKSRDGNKIKIILVDKVQNKFIWFWILIFLNNEDWFIIFFFK